MFVSAIALTVLLANHAAAAEPRSFRFEHLSRDSGLSQSFVYTIVQDPQGYMWFGTENGLNRYNGYEFDHFKRERGNPDALSNDFIFDVAEDAEGNLWIGTNGGGSGGRSAKRPASARRPDAPPPLAPTSTTFSPAAMSSETPSSTLNSSP